MLIVNKLLKKKEKKPENYWKLEQVFQSYMHVVGKNKQYWIIINFYVLKQSKNYYKKKLRKQFFFRRFSKKKEIEQKSYIIDVKKMNYCKLTCKISILNIIE